MSDHPREAERNLKRIFLCNDTCLDVFDLLSPAKVGLALALVSGRFDALVDAHFCSRRWALGKLEIVESNMDGDAVFGKWKRDDSWEPLPIPQMPLPNGVIGFERIECPFVSSDVIAFLQRIRRLLQSDITLEFKLNFNMDDFVAVWPLLSVAGIVGIRAKKRHALRRLRWLSALAVLRHCASLRFVHAEFVLPSFNFPPDDSRGATVGQALCQWLHTPLADGRPKVLRNNFVQIPVDKLETAFLSASTGVSFIIICDEFHMSPFESENSLTRERLELRPIGNDFYDNNRCMIVRSPIDKNAEQWAEWEREALDQSVPNWKVLGFGRNF